MQAREMENEKGIDEKFALVLGDMRIEVMKETLANKSRYFSSLFSHNFTDSKDKEHVINYNIAPSTLENFVEWIHDDEDRVESNRHPIKVSMIKFTDSNFPDLSNLLQLSVLFMADDLIHDSTDVIVLYWLSPDKVVDVWLLAQELSLCVLRDVCLTVCLDRFDELPVPTLVGLSKENIITLLGNSNVRSSNDYLNHVRNEWIQYNMTSDIVEIVGDRKPNSVQCLVAHKLDTAATIKQTYIYTWDGTALSEFVPIKKIKESDKELIGMQVTGRGMYPMGSHWFKVIYMVGGEWGLGTGQFNKAIWRYCLISKKWYYYVRLPVPRRHMVAVFLDNKLTIVGGVSRHRLKLSTVDIFDIHAGTWTKGARVPEDFTEVPPHCVMNGKLFLIKSSVYIYYPNTNHWETILIYSCPAVQNVDAFFTYDTALFLTGCHLGDMVLSRIEIAKDSISDNKKIPGPYIEQSVIENVNVVHEDESCQLRYARVAGTGVMILGARGDSCKNTSLHLYTESRRELDHSFFNPRLGYFNVINPSSLYKSVLS